MRLHPRRGAARRREGRSRERAVELAIHAAGDGHDGREVGRRARALERRAPGPDDVAQAAIVFFRHHERAEPLARELGEHAPVGVLHREHPLEVPPNLVEHVRRRVGRLRDVEIERAQHLRVPLEGPQQLARADAGVSTSLATREVQNLPEERTHRQSPIELDRAVLHLVRQLRRRLSVEKSSLKLEVDSATRTPFSSQTITCDSRTD